MTVYEIAMPPPSSPIATAGTLIQVTAPANLSLSIVGFRLNQTIQLTNSILRLCLVQMVLPATGTPAVGDSRGTPIGAPFTALVAPILADGTPAPVPREYFGWNLVSGDLAYREVPDARISVPAGQSYALRLLSNPPSGGIDVAGALLVGVNF